MIILLGMMVAHLGVFELARYVLVIPGIMLFYVMFKKVYVPHEPWYVIGGGLIVAGMVPGTLLHGNTLSYAYVLFGLLNFFFLPAFRNRIVDTVMVKAFLAVLLITLIPYALENGRAASIYENSNNYSAVGLCALYFAFLGFRGQTGWLLLLIAWFAGIFLVGGSRSTIAAYAIFLLAYWLQTGVFKTVFRFTLVVGMIAVGIGYVTLVTDDRFKLVEAIQQNELSEKNERGLSHRDELFAYSLEIVDDHPWGVGQGMSKYYIEEKMGLQLTPHNTFLKILVEGGWLMLAGYVIVLLGFFLTSQSALASSFLLAMFFRGLFESATPFTVSLVSMMLILPMFLNERTVVRRDLRWFANLDFRQRG